MNSIYNIYQHNYTKQINFFPPQKCAIFAQIQSLYPNVIMVQEGIQTKEIVDEITYRICDLATHWLKLADTAIIKLHLNKVQDMNMSLVCFENQCNEELKFRNNYFNYCIDNINTKFAIENDKVRNNITRKLTKDSISSFNISYFDSKPNISKANIAKEKSIKTELKDSSFVLEKDLNHTDILDSIQVCNAIDLTIENDSIEKNDPGTNNIKETDTFIPFKVEGFNSNFDSNFSDEGYIIKDYNCESINNEEPMQLQINDTLTDKCEVDYKNNFINENNLNICKSKKAFQPKLVDYSFSDKKNVTDCDQGFSRHSFTNDIIIGKLDSYKNMNIIESREVNVCIKGYNEISINTKQSSIFHLHSNDETDLSIFLNIIRNNDNNNIYPDNFKYKQEENKSINLFNDTLDSLINEELAHNDTLSYKRKLYNCFRCRYSTDILVNYQRHLKAHNGRFICRLCNRAFIKSDDLYRHWSTHNVKANNGQYMCDSCNFTAPSKVSVEEHMRIHYRLKMAKALSEKVCCGICKCLIDRSKQFEHKRIVHGRFFRSEASFESKKSKHLSKCLSGKLYKCPECCRHIRNARALLRHHFVAHIQPRTPEKGQNIFNDISQMKCRFCKLDFVEVEELDKHEVGHVISEFLVTDVTSSLKQEMINLDGIPTS